MGARRFTLGLYLGAGFHCDSSKEFIRSSVAKWANQYS
jgi:hypothetical protein